MLPRPTWPLAGQAEFGQNTLCGSMDAPFWLSPSKESPSRPAYFPFSRRSPRFRAPLPGMQGRLEEPERAVHVEAPFVDLALAAPVDAVPGRRKQHQVAPGHRSVEADALLGIALNEREAGERLAFGQGLQVVQHHFVPG